MARRRCGTEGELFDVRHDSGPRCWYSGRAGKDLWVFDPLNPLAVEVRPGPVCMNAGSSVSRFVPLQGTNDENFRRDADGLKDAPGWLGNASKGEVRACGLRVG